MRRPDTSRSRTLLARRSCTRWHLNPHCAQRSRLNVDSTLTTSAPGVSSTTSNTRICTKCSRTAITSQAIGALLDRDLPITDSSRASTPTQGPSTTPRPTYTRRLKKLLWLIERVQQAIETHWAEFRRDLQHAGVHAEDDAEFRLIRIDENDFTPEVRSLCTSELGRRGWTVLHVASGKHIGWTFEWE